MPIVVGKLLLVAEAAERLGLKPATIRAKILRREITYVKLGKSVRIPEAVVDKMIKDGTVAART
jgi:excisionase family DNA binding protein